MSAMPKRPWKMHPPRRLIKRPKLTPPKTPKRKPTSFPSPSSSNKLRKKPEAPSSSLQKNKCSFCEASNAAIVITGLVEKPLCLLHYYTTRNSRVDVQKVKPIGDGSELKSQLPAAQELFAEAFLDLQKQISVESARSFRANASDPLAILNDVGRKPSKMKAAPKGSTKTTPRRNMHESEGGFIRPVELPEKLVLHERRQKQIEAARAANAFRKAEMEKVQANPYKRRKPMKAHYWDLGGNAKSQKQSSKNIKWEDIEKASRPAVSCSCGSTEVQSDCNITGRNDSMAKGETWGNKDRSDIVMRCRCLQCGKIWNEED